MSSVGSELPIEIKRVTWLRGLYLTIGPSGAIAAAGMQASIDKAVAALASGDIVEIVHAYNALRGWEG